MMKKIAIGLVGLVLLVAAGGYLLVSNLDGIVKRAVEKYASAATQADVRLESVKLSLGTGEAKLSGLSIGNPKGFSTPRAFYLGDIDVQLDTNTIKGTGPIIVKNITIDKPQVTYELLNSGDSNLQTIQKNAQEYANAFRGNADAPAETEAKQTGPSRKLIIRHLAVTGGEVTITQEMLQGKQLNTGLPKVELRNVGGHGSGATAAEVAQQLIGAVSNSAAQAAVEELAKEKLNGVLKEVPAGAIGGAAVDNVGNQLKGLIGK